MFSKIKISENYSDNLASKFFNKYKNSYNIISKKEANLLITHIYETLGIKTKLSNEEGEFLIGAYTDEKEYLILDDIKNIFRKYLCPQGRNSFVNNNNKNKNNQKISYKDYYKSTLYESIENLFFEKELNNLKGEYNFKNLERLYFKMIKKYNEKHINNAIINCKQIFKEYDYNHNGYLDSEEIEEIIKDTINLIEEDNLELFFCLKNYKELLTYDKTYGKVSLSDYIFFVLKYLDK